MSSLHVVGRRAFLRGTGGVVVALPFLQMFAGKGHAQSARPPRLVLVFHPQGTLLDRWTPDGEGSLPMALPELLTPLSAHRSRLSVLSGIDNVVRESMTSSNGHNGAARSILTCQPFEGVKQGSQPSNGAADGPSFDWVIGPKLQQEAARPVINLAVNAGQVYENAVFWQAAGQGASLDGDPNATVDKLFSGIADPDVPAPEPTPAERLRQRRGSVLDAVLGGFNRLLQRAPAEDRARLEAHAAQIRALEKLGGGGAGGVTSSACTRPDFSGQFPDGYNARDSRFDDTSSRMMNEVAALALACDVSRVVSIQHVVYDDPSFPWLFGSAPGAALESRGYTNWHAMVHEARSNRDDVGLDRLAAGFKWYMQQVADLATLLSQIEDGPDQTVLDNTVILAISEFGNGAGHYTSQLPVVLVGDAGGRLRTGQHVNLSGHTTGDLFTTIQSLLANDDTPFGMTGSVDGRALHNGMLPGIAT